MSLNRRSLVAAGLAAGADRAFAAPSAPERIVSLNPCLDAILVKVADRGQITAISHYSHDPGATSIGPSARAFPAVYGSAEEVVALRPDLVLAARYGAPATRAALARLGVRLEVFTLPGSIAESLAQVRRMGQVVGRPQRGEALAAGIEAALAAAAPPPGAPRLSALVFQSGGFAVAEGTMMDELLTRTGFDNAASRYGLKLSGKVPLELLIADPPDVLLAGEARPGAPTWADRVLSHPALKAVAGRMRRASLPQSLTYCGGPVLIAAAQRLAAIRDQALEARA
ncbi:MAG: ABC transporter substrate-binding protein [Phenylobacterium sp.]|uniref:ABC transporter substrate-binding protein n=2 Tax=Phenylobacterium sp. TaxID=1871053 RepID=UPI0008B2281D|nr:ABC transporter substrate-binding protein [Phenylobacterium sp.]MBA4793002.1 ABC transporter substrate-binding protein [Phenylobacterium sp.]OHB37984.1 MAG: ABC transporter substrate-binding protein [Phenylobacterium sp. RIFCSPHIGHO2_01_FULL_70_10]